jgi:hypothetical protein
MRLGREKGRYPKTLLRQESNYQEHEWKNESNVYDLFRDSKILHTANKDSLRLKVNSLTCHKFIGTTSKEIRFVNCISDTYIKYINLYFNLWTILQQSTFQPVFNEIYYTNKKHPCQFFHFSPLKKASKRTFYDDLHAVYSIPISFHAFISSWLRKVSETYSFFSWRCYGLLVMMKVLGKCKLRSVNNYQTIRCYEDAFRRQSACHIIFHGPVVWTIGIFWDQYRK